MDKSNMNSDKMLSDHDIVEQITVQDAINRVKCGRWLPGKSEWIITYIKEGVLYILRDK